MACNRIWLYANIPYILYDFIWMYHVAITHCTVFHDLSMIQWSDKPVYTHTMQMCLRDWFHPLHRKHRGWSWFFVCLLLGWVVSRMQGFPHHREIRTTIQILWFYIARVLFFLLLVRTLWPVIYETFDKRARQGLEIRFR